MESLRPLVGKLASEPIENDEAAELVQLCVEVEHLSRRPWDVGMGPARHPERTSAH